MALLPHFLVFAILGIDMTLGQCPTDLSGSLELSQENSKTIKVNWSQILTSSNLEESCIEEVKIVVKQENEAQTQCLRIEKARA